MENTQSSISTRKDHFLATFIGISFALFSIPILRNIDLPFLKLSFATVVFLIIFFAVFANIALLIASIIGKKIPVIFQIAKFSAVGAFNTFLDWGIVNLLMSLTGIFFGFWYSVFNGISFIIASLGSYLWNKHWTFSSGGKGPATGNILQFFVVSLIGLGVKVGTASVVVNLIGPVGGIVEGRWANIGLASATLLSLIWNFLGYKFWVFKK